MKTSKSVLNKLTPENYDKLIPALKEIVTQGPKFQQGIIAIIYDKAITEPNFCEMYAQCCRALNDLCVSVKSKPSKIKGDDDSGKKDPSFRQVLLTRCQGEFERVPPVHPGEGASEAELGEHAKKVDAGKKRNKGNVKFVGELYKVELVTEKVMHQCIRKLLNNIKDPPSEDIEALCQLLRTVGKNLADDPRCEKMLEQYFERMTLLCEEEDLPVRLKFMVKDILELRDNDWTLRRHQVETGPKKLSDVQQEYAQNSNPGKGGKGMTSYMTELRAKAEANKGKPMAPPPGAKGSGRGAGSSRFGAPTGRAGMSQQQPGAGFAHVPGAGGNVQFITKESGGRRGSVEPTTLDPETYNRQLGGLLAELLASGDAAEACSGVAALLADFDKAVERLYLEVLEGSAKDRSLVVELVRLVLQKQVVTKAHVVKALTKVLNTVDDLVCDVPLAGSYVGEYIADLAAHDLVALQALKAPLEHSGRAADIASGILKALARGEGGEAAARALWEESKMDLGQWMASEEGKSSQEVLAAWVAAKGIEWLLPLGECEQHLKKALAEGEEPAAVQQWLSENIAKDLLVSDKGAKCVMRVLLDGFGEAGQATGLKKYGVIAEALYSTTDLQVSMIYEIQLYCHEKNFPSGLVTRLFHTFYDNDIICEEAFEAWKEAVDESIPSKGKTVMHANQFLNWLAEAEEDDSDGESD